MAQHGESHETTDPSHVFGLAELKARDADCRKYYKNLKEERLSYHVDVFPLLKDLQYKLFCELSPLANNLSSHACLFLCPKILPDFGRIICIHTSDFPTFLVRLYQDEPNDHHSIEHHFNGYWREGAPPNKNKRPFRTSIPMSHPYSPGIKEGIARIIESYSNFSNEKVPFRITGRSSKLNALVVFRALLENAMDPSTVATGIWEIFRPCLINVIHRRQLVLYPLGELEGLGCGRHRTVGDG